VDCDQAEAAVAAAKAAPSQPGIAPAITADSLFDEPPLPPPTAPPPTAPTQMPPLPAAGPIPRAPPRPPPVRYAADYQQQHKQAAQAAAQARERPPALSEGEDLMNDLFAAFDLGKQAVKEVRPIVSNNDTDDGSWEARTKMTR